MKFIDFIYALKLLPSSRRHLLLIMKQLEKDPYKILIKQPPKLNFSTNIATHSRVKSYFWGSRLIKNCHCLPRSIGLYQHLKATGLDVEHRFGVNKQDKTLAAHAWVEYQGKPLNESVDLYNRFTVLKELKGGANESLK